MDEDRYFTIETMSDSGAPCVTGPMTATELRQKLADEADDPTEWLDAPPEDWDDAGKGLIIKGRIVVPRAVEVVTKYEVE